MLPLIGAAVLAVAGGAGWLALRSGDGDAAMSTARDIQVVGRGRFQVVIPASGELEAMKQIEVLNRLEMKAVVTELVDEGKQVKPGDVLFRLADEEISNKIKDAEDAVKTAEAALVEKQATQHVKESAAESEQAKAALAVRLAELALEAWEKGEQKAKREILDTEKRTAQINFDRLVKKYEDSQRLVKDGHISQDECERDRIAMIEAEAKLSTATLDLEVYINYTFHQDEAKKNSDLEQAIAEMGRVKQRNDAEIGNAKAAVASAEYKLASAQDRLRDFREQLTYCTVVAPSGGLVVYASSLESGRWGNGGERTLQVGTELKPNEKVIILPDTSQMVAAVKVNEALSGRIRPGQYAVVTSDALPNVPLQGEVLGIGVLAEQGGWRDPNRRDYTVRVLLTGAGPELGLKPSMRCKAEIVVDSVEDAVFVPIQAVFRQGGSAYVYVLDGESFAQREVKTGRASELDVEIVSGLVEGDRVLLRTPEPDEVGQRDVIASGPKGAGRGAGGDSSGGPRGGRAGGPSGAAGTGGGAAQGSAAPKREIADKPAAPATKPS